ncbi:MAG: hypothetical protein ACFFAJ_06920 [Candidatus Hodarchaeota archaeon]
MEAEIISILSSIVAIFAACPGLYFALKLRLQNKSLSLLSALLFFVFFAHSLNHLLIAINETFLASIMDTLTAMILFFYSFYYWKLYRSQEM